MKNLDFATTTTTADQERSALQALVAEELRFLGLPDQKFDIQASFLTFSPLDLAIRLVWPLSIQFQGKPTGVIQIGSAKRKFNPESRVVITFARIMEPARLRKEIHEWCRVQTAMVKEAVEKREGEWPRTWPRLQVRGARTVDEMPTRPGNIVRHGKLKGARHRAN